MSTLENQFLPDILELTGASAVTGTELVQELWSGYGQILRLRLSGGDVDRVIAKQIAFPRSGNHPRGWNTDFAHRRKVRSYEVEANWYRDWSARVLPFARLPRFLGSRQRDRHTLLLLEDLDASGFPERREPPDRDAVEPCLSWLARFHACFLGAEPSGLWETGTYWHLATRPDEWHALENRELREAAPEIDRRLSDLRHPTLVHGDAKLANFCFAPETDEVAAVDFQYVGGGCGMKDVAYFLGSCLDEEECAAHETRLLDFYFDTLREEVGKQHPTIDTEEIIDEWRPLYPFAWTDFRRFLEGWCPDHWKLNRYSEQLTRDVLRRIDEESDSN